MYIESLKKYLDKDGDIDEEAYIAENWAEIQEDYPEDYSLYRDEGYSADEALHYIFKNFVEPKLEAQLEAQLEEEEEEN